MKKFLYKSFLFLTLIGLVVFALTLIPKQGNENDYLEGIVQKHERLESIDSPKLILAAGSNLAFGIDSEKIEKAFSLPVVNLSLHAGLGTTFVLEELKRSISPGDVVLLSLEYYLGDGNNRLKKRAAELYPPAGEYFPLGPYARLNIQLDETKENIKNRVRNLINPSTLTENLTYSKKAFNKYGDVISHLNRPNKSNLTGKKVLKYTYWDSIKEINQFYDFALKKGVHVFYLFPTYPESQFEINKKVIGKLANDLQQDLNIEIINEPIDFVFPDSLFFDTVYHLNEIGRQQRTVKLIELLKRNSRFQEFLQKAN